eukprot:2856689-Prymnesium_polylepis.1
MVWFNASSSRRGDGYRATVLSCGSVSMLHSTLRERQPEWSPFFLASYKLIANTESTVEKHAGSHADCEHDTGIPDSIVAPVKTEVPLEKFLYELEWEQQVFNTQILDLSHHDVDVVGLPQKYGTSRAVAAAAAVAEASSARRRSR